MRFRSILSIFLLLTVASPAQGNPVVGPTYWDIIFELGYDPVEGRSSNDLACRRIEMVNEFSRLVDHDAATDQRLAATYRELNTMLSSLDVGNLYDLLPYTDAHGQWRAIGISGRTRMDSYHLSQYDPDREKHSTLSIDANGGSSNGLQRFGDMDFRVFIKPVIQNHYRFLTDSQLFTEDLSVVIIPRMVTGLMNVVWLHAGSSDDPPLDLGKKFFINRPSLRVLGGFALEFPGFFEAFTHFFSIENVVSPTTGKPERSQLIDLRIRINRKAIAEKYPEMGAMLEILKGMVYFKGRIFDNQDRLLGLVELDSANDLFVFQSRILKGRILPITGGKNVGGHAGISLTDRALTQFYADVDLHLNMVGLHLDIASLQVPFDYRFDGRGVNFLACLQHRPDSIEAGGRAFGFLPLWLIDMLIPSNVEEITQDFFQVLTTGNKGQGGRFEIASLQRTPLQNLLSIGADGDVLANGTIKLGLRLQRQFVAKQKQLIAELKTFKEELWTAFYQDFQKAKQGRGCR